MLKKLLNYFWPQKKTVVILQAGSDKYPITVKQLSQLEEQFKSLRPGEPMALGHTVFVYTLEVPY